MRQSVKVRDFSFCGTGVALSVPVHSRGVDLEKSAKEDSMGLPNRDELKGKFDQAKGSVKETVGRAVDDRDLEAEGDADRAGGKVQEGFGKVKRKVGEAIEDIGESIRK
jgi:uncharacterized protein YjbJ (UPF0337 family)